MDLEQCTVPGVECSTAVPPTRVRTREPENWDRYQMYRILLRTPEQASHYFRVNPKIAKFVSFENLFSD